MFVYVIKTGSLYNPSNKLIGTCYSGHGDGFNNVDAQKEVGVGPLPVGQYKIGPAHQPVDHLGPFAMPLIPAPTNEMWGRSGFFMHGDNSYMNHTASNGCIIADHTIREEVDCDDDSDLEVVATEDDAHAVWALVTPRPV